MKTAIALIALISLTGILVWAAPNQQQVQDAAKQDEYDVDLQSLLAAAQDDVDSVKDVQSHASEQNEDEDMSALNSLMAAAQ